MRLYTACWFFFNMLQWMKFQFVLTFGFCWGNGVVLCTSRHSDVNLVDLVKESDKEEDTAVLLEGGEVQAVSPRPRITWGSSPIVRFFLFFSFHFEMASVEIIHLCICYLFLLALITILVCELTFRFLLMDDTFLIENRLTLRAMWVNYFLEVIRSFLIGWSDKDFDNSFYPSIFLTDLNLASFWLTFIYVIVPISSTHRQRWHYTLIISFTIFVSF